MKMDYINCDENLKCWWWWIYELKIVIRFLSSYFDEHMKYKLIWDVMKIQNINYDVKDYKNVDALKIFWYFFYRLWKNKRTTQQF